MCKNFFQQRNPNTQKITIRGKNNQYNVFVASNYDILRWCSLVETIDKLKTECSAFEFFYPSIIGDNATNLLKADYVTLFALYSKYIFATAKVIEKQANGGSFPKKQSIVFNFDEVSLNSLQIMYDAFKQYQLEDADEYIIYLYQNKADVRVCVEEFKNIIKRQQEEVLKKQQSDKKPVDITFRYLSKLDGLQNVPYSILGISEDE